MQIGKKKKLEQEYSYQTKQTLKPITRDKKGHYTIIKGLIQEKDIAIINIYALNIGAPQYIRQTVTDIKGETDSNSHQCTDHVNRK